MENSSYNNYIKQCEATGLSVGVLYFWNHEYRHEMRDLRYSKKMEVLNAFLEFNLDISDKSDLHFDLIREVIGDYVIKGEDEREREKRLKESYDIN
jgi:hypothetical protein